MQGSKIMQILCKLETTIEETPVIVCTSHQTEYLTDLMDTFHFHQIKLGDDGELIMNEKYFHQLLLTEKFPKLVLSPSIILSDILVELLQGFLGRFLRRKMLDLEVTTRLANLDMPDAIQWLQRIYCNLYIFVKTTSRTESFLSPSVFMSCPVDSTKHMRQWFIDTWNTTLINMLRQVVQNQNCEAQGRKFNQSSYFIFLHYLNPTNHSTTVVT